MNFESKGRDGLTPEERRRVTAPWRKAESSSDIRPVGLTDTAGDIWWSSPEEAQEQQDLLAEYVKNPYQPPKLALMSVEKLKRLEHSAVVASNQLKQFVEVVRLQQEDAALFEELDQTTSPDEAIVVLMSYPRAILAPAMGQEELIDLLKRHEYDKLPLSVKAHLHFLDA